MVAGLKASTIMGATLNFIAVLCGLSLGLRVLLGKHTFNFVRVTLLLLMRYYRCSERETFSDTNLFWYQRNRGPHTSFSLYPTRNNIAEFFSCSSTIMSKTNVRRHVLEKSRSVKETHNNKTLSHSLFPKFLKKVYPIGLQKSNSSLSLSSLSLSLSQNSNDSSQADSVAALDEEISLALRLISPREKIREPAVSKTVQQQQQQQQQQPPSSPLSTEPGELKRCYWITKNSDKVYIEFHDECWGVPAYDDNKLFELLALCGLLMDYNWTEILKRKETLREVFAGFDPSTVAKMEEKEIMEIVSNKALSLADGRVMCIVDNAKCITKIVREFGSFSSYIWSYVNHKPLINRYKHPRNVPLRSPKAETLSKDLVKRGFRFVGPVIVHSFMQAAGLTIDHLVDCYRHSECVRLAERPWRHI